MSGRRLGDMAAAAGAGFGTSGVRGLVTALTPELCAAYTQAFIAMLEQRPQRLLIGHDLRPSSPDIAGSCHAAARSLGIATVNAGVLPTPALAFAAQSMGVPAIMVTGSHIPFDRNGLKFYRATGEISKQDEALILGFEVPERLTPLTDAGSRPVDPEPLRLYRGRYLRTFGAGALAGLRIGIYEHSSAARDLLHELLRALGAEVTGLGRSDGFVAIDTEAVREEDRAQAKAWAASGRFDAIVTTDGDADRPLLADESGMWLRGDMLGLLASRELGAAVVVTPVNSTTALERSGLFREVRRTRIGSPHVIAAMEGCSAAPVVGFEANGGLLLGSDVTLGNGVLEALPTRDAVLPMLLVLAGARRRGCPVSGLLADLPARHTFSGRLAQVDPDACRALIAAADASPEAMAAITGGTAAEQLVVDRTDGLRITRGDGDVLHVRPSGNAPELRCYTEAASLERAEALCLAALARLAALLSGRSGPSAGGSA